MSTAPSASNKPRGQILNLVRQTSNDRNLHLSPVISRIRDNGPAQDEPVPEEIPKAGWAIVEHATVTEGAPAKSAEAVPPAANTTTIVETRTRLPLSALLLITFLLTCTVYYVSTLQARVTELEQDVTYLNERILSLSRPEN